MSDNTESLRDDLREQAEIIAKQRETLSGSALYKYTVQVYDYLYDNSELNEYDERLFQGSISSVINEIATSKRYYSPIRKLLESPPHAPCVEIYQRGTGKQDSIIRLFRPPPEEWAGIPLLGLTRPARGARLPVEGASGGTQTVETRLASLEKMLNGLKEVNLLEVLTDYDRRLRQLESQT